MNFSPQYLKNIVKYILTRLPLCLLILFFLQSCAPDKGDDTKHPFFTKAMTAKKNESFKDAEKYLNEYLLLKPLSMKGHIELAYLYHENLDEPLKAIYHYRRYLEISPNSSDREAIESLINATKKDMAEKEGRKLTKDQNTETNKLENEIQRLSSLNKILTKENEQLRRISGSSISLQENDRKNSTDEATELKTTTQLNTEQINNSQKYPNSYIVEPGDSLSKISRKIYGNTRYYKLIFQANKEILGTEDAPLIIGQKLVIPKIN